MIWQQTHHYVFSKLYDKLRHHENYLSRSLSDGWGALLNNINDQISTKIQGQKKNKKQKAKQKTNRKKMNQIIFGGRRVTLSNCRHYFNRKENSHQHFFDLGEARDRMWWIKGFYTHQSHFNMYAFQERKSGTTHGINLIQPPPPLLLSLSPPYHKSILHIDDLIRLEPIPRRPWTFFLSWNKRRRRCLNKNGFNNTKKLSLPLNFEAPTDAHY